MEIPEKNSQLIETKWKMHKIVYATLKRVIKSKLLATLSKEKLISLMTSITNSEELTTCLENDELILGLSQEKFSQLGQVTFTPKELKKIRSIFLEELGNLIKEITDSDVKFDSDLFSSFGSNSTDILELNDRLTHDLQNLVLSNNSEIDRVAQLQNDLIKSKQNILEKEIIRIEKCEKELKENLHSSQVLLNNTLDIIYPSNEVHDEIKAAASSLEAELMKCEDPESSLITENEELKQIMSEIDKVKAKNAVLQATLNEIKSFSEE